MKSEVTIGVESIVTIGCGEVPLATPSGFEMSTSIGAFASLSESQGYSQSKATSYCIQYVVAFYPNTNYGEMKLEPAALRAVQSLRK
jgi:hypothetical protein